MRVHLSSTMRRVNTFLLISVSPLTDDYPGLSLYFACLYALVPRVLKSCVTSTSTVLEPGTAATATTAFPRFPMVPHLWHTGLMAVVVVRSGGCFMGIGHKTDRRKTSITFTGPWIATCHKPRTYVCRPPSPQTSCDLRFC